MVPSTAGLPPGWWVATGRTPWARRATPSTGRPGVRGLPDPASRVAAVAPPCGSHVARSGAAASDQARAGAPLCTRLHGAGRGLQGGICTFTPLQPLPRRIGAIQLIAATTVPG